MSAFQELWTIRFWFRGQADRLTKKQTFTDYFEELMNPQNFPKSKYMFSHFPCIIIENIYIVLLAL